MATFLFQPNPINGVQFRPVKIDIHLGVIKIAMMRFITIFKVIIPNL